MSKESEDGMIDARTRASVEHFDRIRQALTGKCIVEVRLPLPNTPFVDLLLVLDDGSRVLIGASSDDGSGVLVWGLNVPDDDEIGLV